MTSTTFDDVCARAESLHQQALTALRQRVAERPEDGGLRWRLAEMLRRTGDLAGAAREYRRLAGTGPRREAAGYVAALLTGESRGGNGYDEAVAPAPFVRLDAPLDEERRAELWKLVEENRDRFISSRLYDEEHPYGSDGTVTPYRASRGLHRDEPKGIHGWYQELLGRLIEPHLAALGIAPFVPERWEMHLLSYRDGDYFKIHTDTLGKEGGNRRVTAIYYFHHTPRRFTGGDVLLFDSDRTNGRTGSRFTRITPGDNTLLIFPSDCHHQVTPIHGPTNLEESRFALVTWLHRS